MKTVAILLFWIGLRSMSRVYSVGSIINYHFSTYSSTLAKPWFNRIVILDDILLFEFRNFGNNLRKAYNFVAGEIIKTIANELKT